MKEESRKQRMKNLTRLGKALNAWHFVYAIIFVTYFPYLVIGTTIHEHVVLFSRYGTLGILLVPFYIRLMKLLFGWYVKTGRTLESPTFVPLLLVGAVVGTLISYVILRIFKHEGNWESTLAISHEDAVVSLFANLLIAVSSGFINLILIYYREGKNIIFRTTKPTPFWKVSITLFAIPLLLMLIVFWAIM